MKRRGCLRYWRRSGHARSDEAKRAPQHAVCVTQGAGSAACSKRAAPQVLMQTFGLEKIQAVRALHRGRAATAVGSLVAGAVAVFTTLPLPHYWQASQMASYYYFFLSSTRRRGASGALAGGAGP